jgi:tetratricopeptide (TPR) repeat protein
LIRKRHWAQAEELLSQAIAKAHQCIDAYLLRAHVREHRYDILGAITDYASIIHLQPSHHEARFQRGLALIEVQQYPAARADFLYLLENLPNKTNSIYYKSSQNHSASGITGITTLQSDMRSEWLNAIGLTYYHEKKYGLARQHFLQAANVDATNALSYINLGLTAERQTDTIAAISHYQHALAIETTNTTALHNLAALARLRRDSVLLSLVDRSSDYESYGGLMHQGLLSLDQTQYKKAVTLFSRALQLSKNHEAHLQRGFAYEKLGQLQDALTDYAAAIRYDPRAEKAYVNRGNVYVKSERYTLAVADYSKAIELNPNNGRAFYNRGIAHHRIGQQKRACEDWQQAKFLGEASATAPLAKVCKK